MSRKKIIVLFSVITIFLLGLFIYNYAINEFSEAYVTGYFGQEKDNRINQQNSFDDQNDFLIRICEDENCEVGTPSGYSDLKGNTIIPIGKYHYCYTDTIKYFGIILDNNGVCKAIDKTGGYLYDVKWFDNGPDFLSDGLFRIIINEKTGYANEKGEIEIEPQFACSTPFKDGKAKVTYDCNLVKDGEHKIMRSENWFYIDKLGNRLN